MADDHRDDVTGAPSDDEGRDDRARQFSRREILRAGMAVPAVLSIPALAAACGGGGSNTAAGHGDHSDSGNHGDHADHSDASHNDNSHSDSAHTDSYAHLHTRLVVGSKSAQCRGAPGWRLFPGQREVLCDGWALLRHSRQRVHSSV